MDASTPFAPHFSLDELRCQCGCEASPEVVERLRALSWALERGFRVPIGQPVIVTSGHRCKAHNTAIGGAGSSRHIHGDAADIKILGWSGERLAGWAECQIEHGVIPQGGIGTYPAHPGLLHYDMRGTYARWAK
jgi:uncharacterized protein YcbK (DUF882 family)